MLEYAPKAQSIDYIKINGMSDNQASSFGYGATSYFDSIIEGIQIKDKQSCEIVAKAIADNNSIIKNNKQYYKEFNSDNYVKMDIFVKDGLIGANRKVYIKSDDINVIAAAAGKEEKYQERIKSLPIAEEAAIIWDSAYMDIENSRRIYNIYKEEYYGMDYEKILNYMVTPNPLMQMSLTFNSKGKTYEAQLPITSDTPKAAQSYVEYINEMCIQNSSSEMNQVKEILQKLSAGHNVSLIKLEDLSIDVVNADVEDSSIMENGYNNTIVGNQHNDTLVWDSSNQGIVDKCITALEEKNAKKQLNINAPIYRITYTDYDKEDNNRMEYYVQ